MAYRSPEEIEHLRLGGAIGCLLMPLGASILMLVTPYPLIGIVGIVFVMLLALVAAADPDVLVGDAPDKPKS